MAIFEEVLTWSERLPLWRRDALRRLCANGKWSDYDIDEILDLAKQHHGLPSAFDPPTSPQSLELVHLPAEAIGSAQVVLTSLHSLANVGRIPGDQRLDFASEGLNLVYGGNGAGKSCYARVLKQACRARSPGSVYPNAYDPNYQALIPSARLEFDLDGATPPRF